MGNHNGSIVSYTRWNELMRANTGSGAVRSTCLESSKIAADGPPSGEDPWAIIDLKNSRPLRPQEMNERIGLIKDPSNHRYEFPGRTILKPFIS